jgi:citrate lyase subunit beta/citryl-CoA lyase
MKHLKEIYEAYEKRDLKALDALATPTFRVINTRKSMKAPLMLSCHKIKHLLKIPTLQADTIILNLEDGVAKEEKPFALVLCALFLSHYKECDKKLVVRVNALHEGGYDEITYLNQFMPDAIRVPKIHNTQEVQSVLALLNPQIKLHLSIETAQAWHQLSQLGLHKRVEAFYLGILDLFADISLPQSLIDLENPTMRYMLAHFLITCKSMGVIPVSFVYQEHENLEMFEKWLHLEHQMGLSAKACISPKQVALVNKIFVNKQEELQRAKVIVKLFEMHQEEGITGFVDEEYGFIDEPIYKGALALLEQEEQSTP